MGFDCVTLSNGDNNLIFERSMKYGIHWDTMIDLRLNRVYKPNTDAYRTIEKELGFKPAETLMVTANPTFGDIEGAAAIGMQSQVNPATWNAANDHRVGETAWRLSQANDRVQRARAIDSTQVNTADRGLRLQPFVIPLRFGL